MDWRSELRKKLQKHVGNRKINPKNAERRGKRSAPRKGAAATADPPPDKGPPGGLERDLFKYRLEDVEKPPLDRKIVTFAKARPHPAPLDRPLIRKPVKIEPAAKPGPGPGPEQKTLVLEPAAGPAAAESEPATETPPTIDTEVSLSREILFSRLLAWIIDTMLSAAGGLLVVFLGSLAVGAVFPTGETLLLSAFGGFVLLILITVFFLFATGQTPGMAATDLKLLDEDGGEPRLDSVLLRTLLFLPVAATGVGLLWALFDPARRCWHDRLSRTRVVPC